MKYGKDIGKKFYEDGTVRRYPGNTCVADVTPGCGAYDVMTKIRKMIEEAGFGEYFTFLPADSYHITVLRGLNDQVRQEPYWPSCLPKDTPMSKVDDHVEAAVTAAKLPGRIRMKFWKICVNESAVTVKLQPADKQQEKILRDFRDRAAEKIGVFFPKHETYTFHISLAYTRIVPENEAAERLHELLASIDAFLSTQPVFETTPPYMAFFDDMYKFSPERVSRKGSLFE